MDTYTREIRKILKIGVVVLVLLGLFLLAVTMKSFKEYLLLGSDTPAMHVITVTGEGEVFAKPDVAEFTFSIIEERQSVAEANNAVAEKEKQAVDMLKEKGIEEDDIKTMGYNVYPRYEYQTRTISSPVLYNEGIATYAQGNERVLVGYEVRETIQVRSNDTQKAGELISALGEIGVQNLSGLTFTVDDEDSKMNEARGKAIEDAQSKAKELADQLGVKLVRIVNFGENQGYYPMAYAMKGGLGMGGATDESVAPTVPVGENQFIQSVSITYEIR